MKSPPPGAGVEVAVLGQAAARHTTSCLLLSSARTHLQARRRVGIGACTFSSQPTDGAEVVGGRLHAICIPGVPGLQADRQAGTKGRHTAATSAVKEVEQSPQPACAGKRSWAGTCTY